ncbi:hypothetical protein ACXHQ0_16745 [Vibrio antiquarius]|uniref:Uncharacterized protein n=1 Tax=Vibrio parahaemolyticus TaxID=670 RepID=A0A8H9NEF4_VIBPH|nr:hypothetical protein [Vibrio parahaemolyticus]UYV29944.1 hypothetical protein M5598_28580 [Vibrio parahaemolyticus]UYW19015.1 hypothetical protein IF561_27710 [Vibrio parahaemolyticus]
MSMESVRVDRGMPFLKRGMRVYSTYSKQFGTITGANRSGNLNIRMDGERRSGNYHPQWQLQYFDDNGTVIAEYKD